MPTSRTFIASAIFCFVAMPALAATPLTPAQIKQTFATGKPFSASNDGGVVFSLTLNVDGTASEAAKGSTKNEAGKWRLSDKGYCSRWANSPEHCYTVQSNGGAYDVVSSSGQVIAHWKL